MSVSKHRAMRIGFVSHFPASVLEQADGARECRVLCRYALALARQGGLNFWLCSPETLEALATQVSLIPTGATDVPATCRHVVPLRPYRLEGIRLFCIDRDLWRQRDRHTRLFTLLELLQRELPSTVLHAWGTFPIAYVTAYTASFLGLPAVVTYGRLEVRDGPGAAFEWPWVARRVALALVHDRQDRHRLLTTSDLTPARVRLLTSALWSDGETAQEALYRRVCARHSAQSAAVGEPPVQAAPDRPEKCFGTGNPGED
jgi:hypothetical protein